MQKPTIRTLPVLSSRIFDLNRMLPQLMQAEVNKGLRLKIPMNDVEACVIPHSCKDLTSDAPPGESISNSRVLQESGVPYISSSLMPSSIC